MKYLIGILAILTLTACSFSEYVQSEKLTEGTNVDAYRTGCDIDRELLTSGYMQYDANQYLSAWLRRDSRADPDSKSSRLH